MPKLKYFTLDTIDQIKVNITAFVEQMRQNPKESDWLKGFFGKDPFVSSRYEFEFSFKIDENVPKNADYKNALALYNLFKDQKIGNAVIYNEQFLSGFIFTFGYEYFMWAMGAEKESHVLGTLFFSKGVRQSIARNVVGRLYRYVESTVDYRREDPFELTKFAFENPATLRMVYSPHMDGEKTRLAYFQALKQWKQNTGELITVNLVHKLLTRLSILRNVSVVDNMEENEIIAFINNFLDNLTHYLNT